jgi:hypothetical protein
MTDEQKHVVTNLDDWMLLNQLLSLRQATKGKTLTFADIMHEVAENYVKPEIAKIIKQLPRPQI